MSAYDVQQTLKTINGFLKIEIAKIPKPSDVSGSLARPANSIPRESIAQSAPESEIPKAFEVLMLSAGKGVFFADVARAMDFNADNGLPKNCSN